MRKALATMMATLGIIFFGMTSAQANTFNGSDFNPEYMTGITQVSAQATDGTAVVLPVWSFPYCVQEDGSGQAEPCVWVSSQQGNMLAGYSVVYLPDLTVYISNAAAEILVSQNATQVDQGIIAPVWNDMTTGVDGQSLQPCADATAEFNNCYWDAQSMGNGMGHDYVVDAHGNVTYQEVGPNGPTGVSAAQAASQGFEPIAGEVLVKCSDTIVRSCYNAHVAQYVQSDGTMRHLQGAELGMTVTG